MRIIIPMAGMGKRMRPHTLTMPKPLLKVAGKPIVMQLVQDLASMCHEPVQEIAFVTGRFGAEVENQLLDMARQLGAKGSIHYQDQALGTAHAVWCAEPALKGQVIIAFADTLFRADFKVDTQADGTIWVKQVDNPSAYGVVKLNNQGVITAFHEKPSVPVSNLAIIGIYHFRSGENLKKEIQYLIENQIKGNNEFQLTDALENMKQKGVRLVTGAVTDWLDCGNKKATVDANRKMLEYRSSELSVPEKTILHNSTIHPPCSIGKNVSLTDCTIGPFVSIDDNTHLTSCHITNSIIGHTTLMQHCRIHDSMIGNHVRLSSIKGDVNCGDFTEIVCDIP